MASTMSISNRKKHLVARIATLTGTEHGEIFKIMEVNDVPFSRNSNGCFFNMSLLDDTILEQVERFVDYCHDNQQRIEDYNKQLNECKLRGTLRPVVSPPQSVAGGTAEGDGDESAADMSETDESDAGIRSDGEAEDSVAELLVAVGVPAAKVVAPEGSAAAKDFNMRKKSTSRFVVAKKRFAKRHVNDRRVEYEVADILFKEVVAPQT
jgi:hypothetical protein